MNQLLSICIPTYKRPALLEKTIRSALKAGKKYNIGIYIADDSVDETNMNVISKIQQEYAFIFHYRNKENLGIDANIVNSINLTTTDYCWIIGEDDLFDETAFDTVLPILSSLQGNIGFVAVNYSYVNNDHTHLIQDKAIPIIQNSIVTHETFLNQYVRLIGFIGACIINKSLWKKVDATKYIGTYYAHVGTIMESTKNKNIYIVEKSLVLNRAEDITTFTWSDKAFEVFFGWETMLEILCLHLSFDKTKTKHIISNNKFVFLKTLASKRSENIYNIKVFKQYIKNNHSRNFVFKIFAFFLAIAPIGLLKVLRKIAIGR